LNSNNVTILHIKADVAHTLMNEILMGL